MRDLNKVAAVLEAAADYYEYNEREKTSATVAARNTRLDKIATAHLATHGEEMPEVHRQKLAKADDASLDVVEELLAKQAGTVAPLGAGASPDNPQPTSVKEAADAADKQFVDWILS